MSWYVANNNDMLFILRESSQVILSLHKKELLEPREINIRKSIRNLITPYGSSLLRAYH